MKRVLLIVAALGSLVLAGRADRFSIIDPARPQVFVSEGRIVVNQEPVIVKRPGTITWTVPWGSNVRFATTALRWMHSSSRCQRVTEGHSRAESPATRVGPPCSSANPTRREPSSPAMCRKTSSRAFMLTIRVLADGKPVELDPTVMVE